MMFLRNSNRVASTRASSSALLAIAWLFCSTTLTHGAITTTGQVNPAPTTTTSSDDLVVGGTADGTMTVDNGSDVASAHGYVGFNSGSAGTATITGAGSTWTNNEGLWVGLFGHGTLLVEAGGSVSNNASGVIGSFGIGSTGTATVTGAGSKWTNSTELFVGYEGNGTLNIEAGGAVSNQIGFIGRFSGSTGVATITGAGSTWTTSELDVGYDGNGTLNIEAGGTVSSSLTAFIAVSSGSTGTATVTGSGSTWTNPQTFVGHEGDGTLNIKAGGAVSDSVGIIGFRSGSTGTATVTGPGSTWTNSESLRLGGLGHGTLLVEAGGSVSSNSFGTIGFGPTGTGTATVTGTGSAWTTSGDLTVGDVGTGTLNVEDSGRVDVHQDLVLAANSGSVGTVNLAGGTIDLNGGDIVFGPGAATFNFTSGTLQNVGNFGSSLHQQGGTLAAGNSPGIMSIVGDYTLDALGTLQVELAGNGGIAGTDFDFYNISGSTTLAGLLDVQGFGGFAPAFGDSFSILTAMSIDTTSLTITPGYNFALLTGIGSQTLQISAIPEPSTYAAIFGGAALVAAFCRRRSRAIGVGLLGAK